MISSGSQWRSRLVIRDDERGRCMTVGTTCVPSQTSTTAKRVKLSPGVCLGPGVNPKASRADWGATAIYVWSRWDTPYNNLLMNCTLLNNNVNVNQLMQLYRNSTKELTKIIHCTLTYNFFPLFCFHAHVEVHKVVQGTMSESRIFVHIIKKENPSESTSI